MQEVTLLELEKREITGKAVKTIRKEGKVPAVIHDHGKPSVVVMAEYQALQNAYAAVGKHQPLHLTAGGKRYTAMIKTISYDPRYNSMSHVVFNAIKANEKVTTEIPVKVKLAEGNEVTPAERNSLLVLHNLTSVEVEAPANKLPDYLEFDGEKLVEVGDHATVADLIVPEGVEVKADPTQTIASVFEPSAVAAANDAAGGDAEAGDESEVESDHESNAEEGTQAPEDQPGGKAQNQPKGD